MLEKIDMIYLQSQRYLMILLRLINWEFWKMYQLIVVCKWKDDLDIKSLN